jgi:cell wall assembly regulator SMI1
MLKGVDFMTKFLETGKKITEKNIAKIEKKYNVSFPQEYKDFLLKYNGGECEPNGFVFNENSEDSDSEVRSFFAIGGIDGDYDLEENINIYTIEEKRLPNLYIPIAEDDLGNLVCISCNETDYGFIYFWDHENENESEDSVHNCMDNMFLLSKSFKTFANSLKELD